MLRPPMPVNFKVVSYNVMSLRQMGRLHCILAALRFAHVIALQGSRNKADEDVAVERQARQSTR